MKGTPLNAAATELRVDGLTNFTTYSLALAATDTFNNPGTLSAPVCAEPKSTNDFFDQYRTAGGLAGGGYCGFGGGSAELAGGLLALMTLAGLAARRVRHRGRR